MSNVNLRNHPKFYDVFLAGSLENPKLFTKNLTPGKRTYGERVIDYEGEEYRQWTPYRSKLAALITQNPSESIFKGNTRCLYLGAASGTTVSHLSDILIDGVIYAVEFAERSIRQLTQNMNYRENVIPIFGDARFPEEYSKSVFTEVDFIYQDVAQPNQAEIAIDNCDYYLKDNGIAVIAIKSQSIDSVTKSEKVYVQEKNKLEKAGYEIIESVNIHKYAANHIALIVEKKIT